MQRLQTLLVLSCFLFAVTLNTFSQKKETGLSIIIRDQFEGVIAAAQITLTKSGTDQKMQAETNDSGLAQFRNLAEGEYRATITAAGFKEYESQLVIVKNGEIKRLEVVLEIAAIESKVNVGETESVDPEKSGGTVVFNKREIENLPDDPEELERTLKRIAQSVVGNEELTFTVNGIQGAKLPPKQQIQQIRINQNIFSAQYDNPYGGGIEIFTSASAQEYSGYASFTFADSRFNAADPFLGRRVPYQSRGYFVNFSGPLGKKAGFILRGSRGESDTSSVVNAVVLNSSLQPVEFKRSFASPTRNESFDLSINADLTKKHKLYLGDYFSTGDAKGQNVGGFSLLSRANNSTFQSNYTQFSDTWLINKNIVNQTRFLISYSANKSFGGGNEAAINVLDSFFGGGSQQNTSSKRLSLDLANETTWQMGRYNLGFGGRLRNERIDQNSTANFGGTYTFSGRQAPLLDANNNPVTDASGNILTDQITSLESYRRTLLFQRLGFSRQQIRALGGGANQFTISGGNPEIKVSQYDYALYVQNSYKVSETVATSFGVRYENQTNINSHANFAPRLGIVWAPKAKEKTRPLFALPRLSLGYGIFYARFSLGNTISVRQTNDSGRSQYLITDPNILDGYPSVPSISSLQQFALPSTKRFIDSAFGTPFQSLLNFSAAKPVAKGYTLNFTIAQTVSFRQILIRNINAPLAGTFNMLNPAGGTRPFGNSGNIYETESAGKIKSTRFSVNLNLPQGKKLSASIRYSFIKVAGDITTGSGSPFDPYDFSQEFGPAGNDGVHSIGGYYYYKLPHRFSIGGNYSINSGSRFNIYTGRDTNGDGFYSERPSFATDLNKPDLVKTKYGILDPNPSLTDRLIPRNLGRGPSSFSFDSWLSKYFGFHADPKNKNQPKQTLSFSLNVRNVFNIINRNAPIGNMSSPNFLRSLSGGGEGITIIDGLQRPNFSGRNLSVNVAFEF